MKRTVLIAGLGALGALAGCKRSVCGYGPGGFDPMSPVWQKHQDWIPPSATVCGHFKMPNAAKTLQIDFENDENPFVTLVDHLEHKGLKRARQSANDASWQTVEFETGAPDPAEGELKVTIAREKGRSRAVLSLSGH